ncbi:MAG: leucine-rich repeat domain-containing protein, partial [Clostridia bacterium]|nr:leucine-rich repeat domain-containing protein [Clostridia bacterium]
GNSAFYNCTSLTSITIGSGVTSIGNSAFYNCTSLTSITIGSSVTSIGSYAFAYCESLTSVTIPNSVLSIGDYAFRNCTSLTSVTIGNSVTTIDSNAFRGCTSLTSVYYNGTEEEWNNISLSDTYSDPTYYGATLYYYSETQPYNNGNYWHYVNGEVVVWEIAEHTEHTYEGYSYDSNGHWQVCTVCEEQTEAEAHSYGSDNICTICGYENVTASEGLEYTLSDDKTYYIVSGIGECTDTDIVIPSIYNGLPVEAIGESAFSNCTSLKSVTIGKGVTSTGYKAFYGCTSLTSVTIGSGVTSIGGSTFYDCISLESVTIPNSVTSIGNSAFRNCSSLTSVVIGSSVTTISTGAFYGCDSLTSVTLPSSVTSIGSSVFLLCISLTSITIPDSVTSIGDYAFAYCYSLTSVYYNGTSEEWNVITIGDYNTSLSSATIYYYSETQPADSGNYWHYVNGVITIWVQGATDAAYVGNSYTIDYTTLTYYIDDVESEEAKEDFASMLGATGNYTLTFTDSENFTCVVYMRGTYYTATGNYSLDNESNIFIFSNCSWTDESDSDTFGDAATFLNDGWAVFGYDGTDVTVLVYIERNQPVYTASGIMQLVNNVTVVGNTYELTDIEYTFSDSVTEERQESIKTSYSQTIGMTMAFNSDGTASFTYPEAVDYMNTMVADMTITYVVNNDNTITITSVYDSDVSIITVKIIDSETLSQELDMLEDSGYSMTYIFTLVTE